MVWRHPGHKPLSDELLHWRICTSRGIYELTALFGCRTTPRLSMSWRLKEARHQQPRDSLCTIKGLLFFTRKDLKYLRHLNIDVKNAKIFLYFGKKFSMTRVNIYICQIITDRWPYGSNQILHCELAITWPFLVLKPKCSLRNKSLTLRWLLMPSPHASPGHQWPWHSCIDLVVSHEEWFQLVALFMGKS